MIAIRTTWLIKRGCMQEAFEVLAADPPELGNHVVRIYTPAYSPNVLVFEMTSESIEEHERWWSAFNASPGAAGRYEKWNGVVERQVGTDIWNVTEFR